MSASAARNGSAAPATRGLWNAAATGSIFDWIFRIENALAARSISGVFPDRTAWAGELRLAITRSSCSSAITLSTVSRGAGTASIPPRSPSPAAMRMPLRRERLWNEVSSSIPAAQRAVSSP
ncbi:hypothetical protein OR1_04023 [Geobacter sp. OR-1]|nr:hypothetical protein OR1_04023 [Geobacter sp. OR-1]